MLCEVTLYITWCLKEIWLILVENSMVKKKNGLLYSPLTWQEADEQMTNQDVTYGFCFKSSLFSFSSSFSYEPKKKKKKGDLRITG